VDIGAFYTCAFEGQVIERLTDILYLLPDEPVFG
jgi:hypothetical protein